MSATDAGFKHTTTPDRHFVLSTNGLDLFRLRVAAYPAKFEIHDST
jgi:hypothetical protein